jgi:hypothetical protein
MRPNDMSPRVAGLVCLLALVACGSTVRARVGVDVSQSTSVPPSSAPGPRGVGAVSANELAQRGTYLGPPGTIPAGTPPFAHVPVPTTMGQGSGATTSSGLSSEQLAIAGDPANGEAKVTASHAVEIALSTAGGFSGAPTAEQPVLVQYVNIYTAVIATAWAVPLNGVVDLSHGPALSGDETTASHPTPSFETGRVISFIDSYTGILIEEEGYGN